MMDSRALETPIPPPGFLNKRRTTRRSTLGLGAKAVLAGGGLGLATVATVEMLRILEEESKGLWGKYVRKKPDGTYELTDEPIIEMVQLVPIARSDAPQSEGKIVFRPLPVEDDKQAPHTKVDPPQQLIPAARVFGAKPRISVRQGTFIALEHKGEIKEGALWWEPLIQKGTPLNPEKNWFPVDPEVKRRYLTSNNFVEPSESPQGSAAS